MKSFLSLLAGVFSTCAVMLTFVYVFLPGGYEITASVELDKKPEEVFPIVNNLEYWSIWAHKGLDGYERNFFGAKAGEGAVYEWRSPESFGRIEITQSKPMESVQYHAYLPQGVEAQHTFLLTAYGSKTVLTWKEEGSLGWDPRMRAYAWMTGMESKLSAEYQKTLDQLLIDQ